MVLVLTVTSSCAAPDPAPPGDVAQGWDATYNKVAAKYPLGEIKDGGPYKTDRTIDGRVVKP